MSTPGRWEIDRDPKDPKAKWVEKKTDGGYRLTAGHHKGLPGSIPRELYEWTKNIGEWNLMMYEAVMDLRRRVEQLEKGKQP